MTNPENTSVGAAVFGPMRLPFLALTPACVALGVATASRGPDPVNLWHCLLALVGGALTHISVNALNEYSDFRSGLDLRTERTPFSGGSGVLPQQPQRARFALITGVVCAVAVLAIGLYFASVRGWAIIPLGLFGLVLVVAYTEWVTRRPFLCLIAPGLGFGPLMVLGTDFVLTGQYSLTAGVASLVPFFLVSDLLLLNQFPDVEADRTVGRRHLAIVVGRRISALVYCAFLLAAYLVVVVGWLTHLFPLAALTALASAAIALPTARGVLRHSSSIPDLIPHMRRHVLICLSTPLLLALGLWLG